MPPTSSNSFLPPPSVQTFASQSSQDPNTPHSLARKTLYRDQDEPPKPPPSSSSHGPPPRTSSRNAKMIYASHPELYTQNDLNTYSFGAAGSSTSPSLSEHPLDPLSRPRDDHDSDDLSSVPDTTPRPSVVAGTHNPHQRSHQSQYPNFHPLIRTTSDSNSDIASHTTLNSSSASASVSSLSRPSESVHSRATSRSRRSTTPHTSSNDLTSDEDDLDSDGRHPIPNDFHDHDGPSPMGSRTQSSSLYLSEEDFPDDFEQDSESDPMDDDHDYTHTMPPEFINRRGSRAIPIPSSNMSDAMYQDGRARENSMATIRRPSKSLEDLQSFSFAQSSHATTPPRAETHNPHSVSPNSVPQSEGDWREFRKRSMQREMLPPMPAHLVASIAGPSSAHISQSNATYHSTPSAAASSTVVETLDTSWMDYGLKGVVDINPEEMADIVGESGAGSRSGFYPFRKGSTTSRRASTISSNVDIMHKNITGVWASQKAKDQRANWLFVKDSRIHPPEETKPRPHPGLERERPSISNLFRPTSSSGGGDGIHGSVSFFPEPKGKGKEKEKGSGKDKSRDKSSGKDKSRDKSSGKGKDKSGKDKPQWRGMALDAEEAWTNGFLGKYRVIRKNVSAPDSGKAPQQRLNVAYIRNSALYPNGTVHSVDGPAVTIHKHSKAGAFSISRHYRIKTPHNESASSSSQPLKSQSSRNNLAARETADALRKKTSMILLAPRKVQKAYTSTNTTRKLDTHGLLDDSTNASQRDLERRKEHEREREWERERERERDRERERERERQSSHKGKEKERSQEPHGRTIFQSEGTSTIIVPADISLPDSSEDSSAGSVPPSIHPVTSAVTTPENSDAGGNSLGSVGSIEQSIMSYETNSSDKTISRSNYPYQSQQRKREPYDILEEDSDSDSSRPRYPTRTPHRETYAALPPEVFEAAHQHNPSTGLFGWGKSKNADRNARANTFFEQSYNPPWPVTAPRSNQETRKGIVDDLNMSFQDVGLLPAVNEIRPSGYNSQYKKRRDKGNAPRIERRPSDELDIFEEIPADALYMLLPLWPGETDPYSMRKHPFAAPVIPMGKRAYLLIYYRTMSEPTPIADETSSKHKSRDKKKLRNSPTSSRDSMHRRDDRSVFMKRFHICARLIHYHDLQGTGVRIPDQGLAVTGGLQDAYDHLPKPNRLDNYVIGVSHSREGGIEFVAEGFEQLGLARLVPNPRPVEISEDDDTGSMDTIPLLTPIGRSVMEMAWLGGLAVTSFSPPNI